MVENNFKTSKSTCTFCQTSIKNESETFYCPSCSSPYHKDCWLENKGCAVYGCGEKVQREDEMSSFRDSIINIEYLINRNQFSEAIYEAKQLLKVDRRNTDLKNLYNKAVALINNKINLMTSGDEAFGKKDYKAAEVYYKNVLKYADELESNFVNTRLEIAKEKIPDQERRRIYQNILIIIIIVAILSAIGYLGYYTFILKEDRDYSELLKSDNASDLSSMEKMIGKYEIFLKSYSNGKDKDKAINKINQYSYQIASKYYKDDWRLALKYYNKIYNSIDSNDAKTLFNNIYNTAYGDYEQKIGSAKKFNAVSKYSEALNELNNAKLITSVFPNSNMTKESSILESNAALLNKKISSIVKSNDLEREIRAQDMQLSNVSSSGNRNTVVISAKIIHQTEPNIYSARQIGSNDIIAIKTSNSFYKTGEIVNIECVAKGKIAVTDDRNTETVVQMFMPFSESEEPEVNILSQSERDGINERLKNLKAQKTKIDSLLKSGLL